MNTQSETITCTTDELRVGDVVLEHGMRVLLSREPSVTEEGTTVWAYTGQILNLDEAKQDGAVPLHWLYPEVFDRGWKIDWSATPRWVIQGNDRKRWCVERRCEPTRVP